MRLLVDRSIYSLSYLSEFVLIVLFFIIIRKVLFDFGFHAFTKKVRIDRLKPGMIPAETIRMEDSGDSRDSRNGKDDMYIKEEGKYIKEEYNIMGRSADNKKLIVRYRPEGLSEKEIKELKRLQKSKMFDFRSIRVYETLPFAPFMFAGVILVVAAGFFV